MEQKDFEELLKQAESDWLEWKADFPTGILGSRKDPEWQEGKGELIKDLTALANSPGKSPAFLVYGVKDFRIRREVRGTSTSFDDAMFQEWIRRSIDPQIKFHYSEIEANPEKKVALFEIEKTLPYPHVLKVDLGTNIHKGQVWFRIKTQNNIALYADLEKMFRGELPCRYESFHDPEIERIKKLYQELGREPTFPLLYQKEAKLIQGYEIEPVPGTRKEILVGFGERSTHVFMLKPRN
jgi:predicted HTH transcriptional regulator